VTTLNLSPDQKQIALGTPGLRVIVEAGPGTGKTETVAHRIVALISQGLHPAQILVLSFSRNAVRTLTRRLGKIAGITPLHTEQLRHLSVRTFDSWTFRMLRQLNHLPMQLLQGTHDDNINLLVHELQSANREAAMQLMYHIRHVVIDEFQDLSGVRGALVLEMMSLIAPPAKQGNGFTVLGDPAQAIYAFSLQHGHAEHIALTSGALVARIRETYKKGVATLTLQHNYRTTDGLGSLAANLRRLLLRRTNGRTKFTALRDFVSRIKVTDEGLKPSSILHGEVRTAAVLTSTNGEAIRVAQKLIDQNSDPAIPIILHSPSQARYVPPWIGALLGPTKSDTLTRGQFSRIYVHCFGITHAQAAAALNIPSENDAWQRLTRACEVGGDATSIDVTLLRSRLNWADLLPDDEGALGDGIHVMTIHQSKGMEFDAVAVMPENLLDREFSSEDEHLEAANVLFVGMTRAAKQLFRVDKGQVHRPMFKWAKGDRSRWCCWFPKWVNLEMGVSGDIDAQSFVDRRVFAQEDAVANDAIIDETQHYLATNAASLRGKKVMLCRWRIPDIAENRFVYRIHIQDGNAPGRILGLTTESVTYDLLSLLHEKGYSLPAKIYNLRIVDVVTLGLSVEARQSVALPYSRSGLWLGVNIYGSGDFQLYRGRAAGGTNKKSNGKRRSKAAH